MFGFGLRRVVQTGRSAEDALAGLRLATVTGALFALDRPAPGTPPLRGVIDGARFSLVRRTQFRNSFTPVVEGEVVPAEVGSQVQLRLGMHAVPFVALLVWLVALLSLGVVAAQQEALEDLALVLAVLSVVGPVAGYVAWRADVEAIVQDVTWAITHAGPQA